MTASHVDTAAILASVRDEMARYDYDAVREQTDDQLLGVPWSASRVAAELAGMERALIEPYWQTVQINDRENRLDRPSTIEDCLIFADDNSGYLLGYVPSSADFALIYKGPTGTFATIGIHGDPVGCFLAR